MVITRVPQANHRSKGGPSFGSVVRGAHYLQSDHTASASIPGKFETVLHEGQREYDGFQCRTHRFGEIMHDLPGPGAYYSSKELNQTLNSYSSKGMGNGFISKTKRFSTPTSFAQGPGPGNYHPVDTSFRTVPRKPKSHQSRRLKENTSPIRVPPSTAPLERGSSGAPLGMIGALDEKKQTVLDSTPGPGQYDAQKPKKQPQRASAVFKSSVERIQGPSSDAKFAPAPGQYEVRGMSSGLGANTGPTPSQGVAKQSSVFLSSTGRGCETKDGDSGELYPDMPVPSMRTVSLVGNTFLAQQALLDKRKRDSVRPGPGEYNLGDGLCVDKLPTTTASSSFVVSVTHDRFGRSNRPTDTTPGPGEYQNIDPSFRPRRVAERDRTRGNFFFQSSIDRRNGGKPAAPGPAYYNPSRVTRKSFHLNNNRKWL